jgi:hypothetical protein
MMQIGMVIRGRESVGAITVTIEHVVKEALG